MLWMVDRTAGDAAQAFAPLISQALQDQAGLKLESIKGPVEVLCSRSQRLWRRIPAGKPAGLARQPRGIP
jgi:hypothetical protein